MNTDSVRDEALRLYCKWLNEWQKTDSGQKHRYEPEQFLRHDPEAGLHGHCTLVGVLPDHNAAHGFLLSFVMDDGDDGGPTSLTVWADELDGISHITQGFDTMTQSIYDRYNASLEDNRFLNTPREVTP